MVDRAGESAQGAPDAPARERVEVLELGVRNNQYQALDFGEPGVSLGDMDVYSGKAIKDGREVGHGGGSCQVVSVEGDDVPHAVCPGVRANPWAVPLAPPG